MQQGLLLPGLVGGGLAAYFAAVPLLFAAVNRGVPSWLEPLLMALALPAVLSMQPWLKLLRRLGWTQGEWWLAPHPLAYALLALLYSLLAALLTLALLRWLAR